MAVRSTAAVVRSGQGRTRRYRGRAGARRCQGEAGAHDVGVGAGQGRTASASGKVGRGDGVGVEVRQPGGIEVFGGREAGRGDADGRTE